MLAMLCIGFVEFIRFTGLLDCVCRAFVAVGASRLYGAVSVWGLKAAVTHLLKAVAGAVPPGSRVEGLGPKFRL